MRAYLRKESYYNGYKPKLHKDHTTVICVSNLKYGLKASKADVLSYDQFLALGKGGVQGRMLNNPRAIYKIKRADGEVAGLSNHSSTSKFGKVFNHAGLLRRYVTQSYQGVDGFKGAKVVEIELAPDNINTQAIREYDLLEFYKASPSSRKHLQKRFSQMLKQVA